MSDNPYGLSPEEYARHQELMSDAIESWPQTIKDEIDQIGWTSQSSGQSLAQSLADVLRGTGGNI